jgi:O-antigen ligase
MIVSILVGAVAAALAVLVHPLAAPLLAVAVVVAGRLVSNPMHALTGFVVTLYARPADLWAPLAVLRPSLMLAGLAGVAWAVSLLGRLRFARLRTDPWMLGVSLWCLVSVVLSTDVASSWAQYSEVFFKIIILYVLVSNLISTPAQALTLRLAVSTACGGLGAYAMYGKITGQATIEGTRAAFVGLIGDPNDLAFALLTSIPFLLEAVVLARGRGRLGVAILLIAAGGGLVSTVSRGGILGLSAAMFWILSKRLASRAMALGIVAAMASGAAVVGGLADRTSGGSSPEGELDESAQARLDAWKAGGRMMMRRPASGVGLGQFMYNYESYASDAVIWGHLDAHNAYVKAGAETGPVGLLMFLGLLGTAGISARRLENEAQDSDPLIQAAATSALPTLMAVLVAACFLSQCWSWFLYLLVVEIAALERVMLVVPGPRASPNPSD